MSTFEYDAFIASFKPVYEAEEDSNIVGNELKLECFEEAMNVTIYLEDSVTTVSLSSKQKALIEDIVSSSDRYYQLWMEAIVKKLQEDPTIWGMWDEGSEVYEIATSIKTVKDFEEYAVAPDLCILPEQDGELVYGFGFLSPEFDDEHGYGVVFVGGEATQAGPYGHLIDEFL